MVKAERRVSKDLSFSYKNEMYQLEVDQLKSTRRAKVQIFESHGEVKMVVKDGKELKYRKWKEQAAEVAVIDVKQLETHWSTRLKKKQRKHHPWR